MLVELLDFFEAKTKNPATNVPTSMTEENLRDPVNLSHEPPSERQHYEEIAEHVV